MHFPDVALWTLLAAVLVYFAFNIVRRGGLRGALFNARISSTVGEVDATGPKLVNQRLKVHVLERGSEHLIGIEVVSKTIASYQMFPLVLSPAQAQELAAMLQLAIAGPR